MLFCLITTKWIKLLSENSLIMFGTHVFACLHLFICLCPILFYKGQCHTLSITIHALFFLVVTWTPIQFILGINLLNCLLWWISNLFFRAKVLSLTWIGNCCHTCLYQLTCLHQLTCFHQLICLYQLNCLDQ